MMSAAARGRGGDPEFLDAWKGLSVLDTYKVARQNGGRFKWRHGEYIAILNVPDDAPFTYRGPEHRGHWMIYDAEGIMLTEDGAELLRQSYVVRVVHGPSTEESALETVETPRGRVFTRTAVERGGRRLWQWSTKFGIR